MAALRPIIALLVVASCTTPVGLPDPPATTSPPAAPSQPRSPTASRAERPHPVSLRALMEREFDGRAFRIGRTLASTSGYTSRAISYRGGGLRITGVMFVPRGGGPWPVVVANHGYIDPAVYSSGRGLERTQSALASRGFAVVHIDYRNHAGSDRDPNNDVRLRLGYVEDAINAVRAIKRSELPYLDTERIAMLGRSMGGGVTLGAIAVDPSLVRAAVLVSSVSSDAAENFNRFIRRRPEVAQRIIDRYGAPRDAPAFWQGASARTFIDRIEAPMLVQHGTADDTCPIRWADDTVSALRDAEVDVTYRRYAGEGHQFYARYDDVIRHAVAFLRHHMDIA